MELKPADDVLLVYAQHWHEDPHTNQMNGFEKGDPGVFRAKRFLEQAVLNPPSNFRLLGVWEGTTPIGYVGFSNIDEFSRSANLHITMAPTEQGKGYGKEVVSKALDKAFDSGLYRVTFKPLKSNKAACSLAKKVGFTLEAFTKASCWVGNSPKDQAQFRMLRKEWYDMNKESEG